MEWWMAVVTVVMLFMAVPRWRAWRTRRRLAAMRRDHGTMLGFSLDRILTDTRISLEAPKAPTKKKGFLG